VPVGPHFPALQSEGYLARGCLSTGLTALRKAQLPDKANFYTGFFQISIALERVLKLVLIIEHMKANSFQPPTQQQIKSYSHDLVRLYAACIPVAQGIGMSFSVPVSGTIEDRILRFLSEFSTKSRYYNLDSLASSTSGFIDPLVSWDGILNFVLSTDVSIRVQRRHVSSALAIHSMLQGSLTMVQTGMSGSPISSQQAFVIPVQHQIAAPYAVARLFNVLRPALSLLGEVADQTNFTNIAASSGVQQVPFMREFFVIFDGTPAQIRNKKRWP
jgi:hypothetical protein